MAAKPPFFFLFSFWPNEGQQFTDANLSLSNFWILDKRKKRRLLEYNLVARNTYIGRDARNTTHGSSSSKLNPIRLEKAKAFLV